MRTTLDLDEDVVAGAKQLARSRGRTLGEVVSELARQSLQAGSPPAVRNGFRLFASRNSKAGSNLRVVNELRDSE